MIKDTVNVLRLSLPLLPLVVIALLGGCVAQQADMKQTERTLHQKLKQQDDQFAQAHARQNQEISSLREQEIPQLRGELEKAYHQAEELQERQQDLKYRIAQLEQLTKKLEQLTAKVEADAAMRYAWVQKSLDTQDEKGNARLSKLSEELDSVDVVLGTILLRMEDFAKRLQAVEQR